jgi:hypothetical protein
MCLLLYLVTDGPKKNGRARQLHSEEALDATFSDTDAEDAELEDEMVMEVVDEGPAARSGDAAAGQAARRARGSEAQRRSRADAVSAQRNEGALTRMFGWLSRPPADAAPPAGVIPLAEAAAAGPTAPAIRRLVTSNRLAD